MTDNITVTLKPCPFCGGVGDISYWTGPGADSTPKGHFIECDQCSASGPSAEIGAHTDAKAEAITAWNTRTQQEAKAVEGDVVEALRLASNRLRRLAVEFDTGSRQFYEAGEWADEAEASATLSKSQDKTAELLREARDLLSPWGPRNHVALIARIDDHLSQGESA